MLRLEFSDRQLKSIASSMLVRGSAQPLIRCEYFWIIFYMDYYSEYDEPEDPNLFCYATI